MKKQVKWILMAVMVIVCASAYGVVLLQPVTAETESLTRKNLERRVTVEGTILPVSSLVINAEESGNVSEVLCKPGMEVKEGEPLLRTDADSGTSLNLQREQLSQQLSAARQEYDRLYGEDGVAALAEKTAEVSYLLAEKNYENGLVLFQQGFLSQAELDGLKNSQSQAKQAYQLAKNGNSQSSRSYYLEQIASSERQLALLDKSVEPGTVGMPFDGVVWEVYTERGSYISAGQPIFKVYPKTLSVSDGERTGAAERTDQMKLEVSVLSEDGAQLEPGMTAVVSYEDGSESEAEITFVSRVASQMISSIGMEESRCMVELKPEFLPANAGAGQRADVTICILKGEQVITVPSSAIVVQEEGKAVYVLHGKRAEQVLVETGQRESGRIEILSGLEEGDVIVADPYESGIRQGTRVKAEPQP